MSTIKESSHLILIQYLITGVPARLLSFPNAMTMSTLNVAVSYHQNYNIVSLVNIWAWKKKKWILESALSGKQNTETTGPNWKTIPESLWFIYLPNIWGRNALIEWWYPGEAIFPPCESWEVWGNMTRNKMSNKMYNKSRLNRGLVVTIIQNYDWPDKKVSNTGS